MEIEANEYGQTKIIISGQVLRITETDRGRLRISADEGLLVIRPGGGQNVVELSVEGLVS